MLNFVLDAFRENRQVYIYTALLSAEGGESTLGCIVVGTVGVLSAEGGGT